MDFTDTTEEAEYRAGVRAWLHENAEPKRPGRTFNVKYGADDLVPLADSEILTAELKKIGVTHELLIIKGGDHGFRTPEHRTQATNAMVAWFKKHLTD